MANIHQELNSINSSKKRILRFNFFNVFFILSIGNHLSDKQKKRLENPKFIGLTRVSRVNTIWGNHLHISNGVQLLVNISHMAYNVVTHVTLYNLKPIDKNLMSNGGITHNTDIKFWRLVV